MTLNSGATLLSATYLLVRGVYRHTPSLSHSPLQKKKGTYRRALGTQNINKYPSSISPWNHPRSQDHPVTLANLSIAPRAKQLKGKQKCSWWLFPLADIVLFIFPSKLNNRREEMCHVGGFFWSKILKRKRKMHLYLAVTCWGANVLKLCSQHAQSPPPDNPTGKYPAPTGPGIYYWPVRPACGRHLISVPAGKPAFGWGHWKDASVNGARICLVWPVWQWPGWGDGGRMKVGESGATSLWPCSHTQRLPAEWACTVTTEWAVSAQVRGQDWLKLISSVETRLEDSPECVYLWGKKHTHTHTRSLDLWGCVVGYLQAVLRSTSCP